MYVGRNGAGREAEVTMIPRPSYLEKIRPFVGKDIIKVLTGVRRCGKSTILQMLSESLLEDGVPQGNIVFANMESGAWHEALQSSETFYEMIAGRLREVQGKAYLFLDEVQEVPSWERAINSLRVDFNCDIYLTGSNARMLSTELGTLLTGRYLSIEVQPLSFAEIVNAYPGKSASELFRQYLVMGGMPFLSSIEFSHDEGCLYLGDVLNSIILRDIVQRTSVRKVDQLDRILRYFISETGTTFSAKNLANVLKNEGARTSIDTIYSYLSIAEESLLLSRARRFDLKGKDILRGEEKVYVVDQGFRESLFANNGARPDLVLETIVFNDLRRRGYKVFVGRNGTKEIDFVAEGPRGRMYVQVAYLLASEETVSREFGAFAGIDDNYPRYVVTMDELDFSRNGIRHLNVRDFLLTDEL